MTRVKICGITSLNDARAAIEAGADMLGFNFYRPSQRFIEPSKARKIIESLAGKMDAQPIITVGVFANESSPVALMRIVEESGVSAVQLHGDESVEFCQTLKQLLNGKSLIKVLRVIGRITPTETEAYDADAIMLDSFHNEMRGGTGHVFYWSIARAVRECVPRLFFAVEHWPGDVARALPPL